MHDTTVRSLNGKLILTATILASGMAFLDGSVVNIAIPVMQSTFNTTLDKMQWVINSYALFLAALLLISGSFGDRFGRKKIFLYGISIFVLSSVLCGIANSINQLILFRGMQGIGAAMMVPGSLSIISTSFDERVRGKAIGLWSGFAGGVAALGPFLGGWLVESFGWSSIFFINIPLGMIAFVIAVRFVPESKSTHAQRVDILGAILIFLSLLALTYGLIEAPGLGWSHFLVISSLLFGIIAAIVFIFVEMRVKHPLIPLEIFKSPLVTGANISTLFLYFALSGVIFFFVLQVQQIQQYSPLAAGMSLLPTILIITFLSGSAGGLSDRIGPRRPMIIGPLIVSLGMALLLIPGENANYLLSYLPGLILFGLGMALVIAPLTKSALAVAPNVSGAASGVNNAVSRIAGLFAIALLGAIVLSVFSSQLTQGLTNTSLTLSERQQILEQRNKLGAIAIPESFSSEKEQIVQREITAAFFYSYRSALGIAALLAFLSAVTAYFLIHNPQTAKRTNQLT